jgi:hypothetical protein
VLNKTKEAMPRVGVPTELPGHDPETLLTEHVPSEMLADEHDADQLVEHLGGPS